LFPPAFVIEKALLTQTADKINHFLREKVIGRKKRKKGGNVTDQTVGVATVKAYLAGVMDLYKQQVILRTNSNPNPSMS
jgi:hypothetical protein